MEHALDGAETAGREAVPGPAFAASRFAPPTPSTRWVPRPGLLARLEVDDSVPLALVLGSAGSGKSSLLAQWVVTRPAGDWCWLNCDTGDTDPTRFWRAVILAIDRVRPHFAEGCRDLLTISSRVDHDLLEQLLIACETLSRPTTLVLDDLHLAGPDVQNQLSHLISRGLGRLRIIAGARTEPALPLGRLRLARRTAELGELDLRFTAGEVAELIDRVAGGTDAHEVDLVMTRTDGWAVGVQLAAVALRDADRRAELVERLDGSTGALAEYLWSEVFEAQNDDIRRFLMDTVVTDELTPGLAAALSPGTPVTLVDIERANLLLVRLDPNGQTFRYHHLFAEVLRERLRALEPERELELHRRAAQWYTDQGDDASAFRHWWRAGHRIHAIAPMHGLVLDAYVDNELPTLSEVDRILTNDDLRAAPGPAISYGGALLVKGFAEDAERVLSRIATVTRELLTPSDRQQLEALRGLSALVLGDTRAAIAHGNVLVHIADEGGEEHDWVAVGLSGLLRAHVWEARPLPDARPEIVQGSPLARVARFELAGTTAFERLMAGDLSEALAITNRLMEETGDPEDAHTDVALYPATISATALLERGDLGAAEPTLRLVSDDESRLRLPIRVLAKIGLGRIWRAEGNIDAAHAVINGAFDLLPRRPAGSGIVDHLSAWRAQLLLDAGDREAAAPLIAEIASSCLRVPMEARLAVASADLELAQRLLASLRRHATTRRQRLDLELVTLSALARGGHPVEEAARRVFDLAAPEGILFPLVEAGSDVLEAVRLVARRRPATPYVEALMRMRPMLPAPSRLTPHVEPLSERERTVLTFLATSMTYAEIADQLYVSVNTVKSHAKSITRKLQASSRAEALARARELHYL